MAFCLPSRGFSIAEQAGTTKNRARFGRGSEAFCCGRRSRPAADLMALLAFLRSLLRGLLFGGFLGRFLGSFLLSWLLGSLLGWLLFCSRFLLGGLLLCLGLSAATARGRGCGLGWRRPGLGGRRRRNRHRLRINRFGCRRAGFFFLLFFLFEIFFQRLAVSAAVAEFLFFVTSVERGIVERHCSS